MVDPNLWSLPRAAPRPYCRAVFAQARLADGRRLEYVDLGDPSGRPVLFFHGTPSTAGMTEILARTAADSGIRLVGLTRPGYGGSDPSPPGLAGVAADALELMSQLDLDRCATMGFSGGGPFALAVAAAAPGRVTGVAVHAGSGSYFELMEPTEADAPERSAIALLDQGDVEGAVVAMTASADADFATMRGLSEVEFAEAMRTMKPPDEHWLDDRPEQLSIFLADHRRAVAESAGYVRDVLSWGSRWDVDLSEIAMPVRLVYGARDAMVPISHGEWLRARLDDPELVIVPGGHGDACFGQAEQTFRLLTR
jgi:pimeloyl-ACP methyl ester carboxylesterase